MDVGMIAIATAQSGDLAAVARQVEALGFDSLWIPEHPVVPVDFKTPYLGIPGATLPEHYNRWVDPFVALTVAATVTKKIKLGTGICLLPERDPLVTAKVVASLDFYSGGRVIIGAGAGWLKEETEVMGTRFASRWKRLRETVEAMRILWTQREAGYEGELVRFIPVRCEPKPVQKPYPPVLLGAHGPKGIQRVARYADGWFPLVQNPDAFRQDMILLRKLTVEAGRNPDSLQVTILVDPEDGKLSADTMKRYRDAGANRIIPFSLEAGAEMADGKALEWVKKLVPLVERAQHV